MEFSSAIWRTRNRWEASARDSLRRAQFPNEMTLRAGDFVARRAHRVSAGWRLRAIRHHAFVPTGPSASWPMLWAIWCWKSNREIRRLYVGNSGRAGHLAVALSAAGRAANLSIDTAREVRIKTLAQVAQNRAAELRAAPQWPAPGESRANVPMAEVNFDLRQNVSGTANAAFRRVAIEVRTEGKPESHATLVTYIARIPRGHAVKREVAG